MTLAGTSASEKERSRCYGFVQRVAPLRQFFQARPKLAHLGALRRDLLADQSCGEQNAAEDEAGLDQIDQWPEAFSRTTFARATRSDPDDHAEREQAAPSIPNSSSGFFPNRSSNQTDSMSSTPTGMRPMPNFDLPGVARVQRDRDLGDGESLRGGDHDHVAVPVGTQPEALP